MEEQVVFPKRFIGFSNLVNITSLKKTSLYELIKTGDLKPLKLGRKTVFLESEVIAWMDSKLQSRKGGAK